MSIFYKQFQSMGTRLDLVLSDADKGASAKVAELVHLELIRLEHLLSVYDPDSEISTINDTAGDSWVGIGKELSDILEECVVYHALTSGYFDITIKPAMDKLVKERSISGIVPDDISALIGMDKLIMEEGRIRFKNKGMALDMGGYGKGYAVRCLLKILREHGITNALISFGESLVYGHGHHPHGDCWKLAIPGSSEDISIELLDEGISTSGNTLNNQKKFGNSGHVFNPVSLFFRTELGSVSIKAEDPVKAEVLSTAFFGAGKEASEEMTESIDGIQTLWWF